MKPSPVTIPPTSGRHKTAFVLLGCGVLLCVAAIFVWLFFTERPFQQVLQEARTALAQSDYETAQRLADELLERVPDSPEALLISGQASLNLGHCSKGEQALGRLLTHEETNHEARMSLVRLLKMQGRFWELRPHALLLLRTGDSGSEYLIPLAAPDGTILGPREFELAESCRSSVPDDSLPMLGLARHWLQNAEIERAEAMLREVVADAPEVVEAQTLLGAAVLQLDDSEAFLKWHDQLPETADAHPEIWFLRGMWVRNREQPQIAIRCFWEAVVRDPNHRRANYQLSQALVAAGKPEMAEHFTERFQDLEEVARLATRGNDSSGSQLTAVTMYRVAHVMENLGRLWEAVGWYRTAIKHQPQFPEAQQQLEQLAARIDENTPLTLRSSNPATQVDLSSYPLPDWSSSDTNRRTHSEDSIEDSQIAFADQAESLGLNFSFHNGASPKADRARMFEFSGGGVAILDYDGDGWPDVYLTQGCPWPPATGNSFRDRLFRNVNGERFEDVTEQCGLGDERYSQGTTVGDFNNDGLPDIFLANIGANRLYCNNGDGTFADVTESVGVGGDDWTLSCMLADVNGDTLPDLYCVNYLGGDDVFTRRCDRQGRPVQCPLQYFSSAQDRLFLNLGDGRFEDVTETSGIKVPEGKGMGIVGADFQGAGRLSLFIANDDKPNFFFANDTSGGDHSISFLQNGIGSGLAFGDWGTAQSCMGIAAGDVNNDGRLDLFVTNFANEHSNLYVQQPGMIFHDVSRQAGLHLPTLQSMGWGCQFLDADLDGLSDLLVANGHLDRNTAGELPYEMPTQVFRNLGGIRFAELSAEQIGPYFMKPHVGRAVARIDWNRDGADDACITHVDRPVALLTNQSSQRGHFLCIHLRGVNCSRDAIGSVVKITAGDAVWYQHLTAGDGFQSSNQRKLTFGFSSRKQIDEVTIVWPSGLEQLLRGLSVDQEILIVEGRPPRILRSREASSVE
ncbi:MAG: tetratricopeptide repeat protein [Planctomycetaceae bacterium]|nr:tetratricopeptide repeat protein [Planctomycetaceae bacterium]MBT6486819.1 tetratricopeptide repeat protein [Planctomycetaceae bacterium]MBT6493678.1 tetratricopeptide repeat protein [Planctomycetaceae bacterium]